MSASFRAGSNEDWLALCRAVEYAVDHQRFTDEELIKESGNEGLLSRPSLTKFRLESWKRTGDSTVIVKRINVECARRLWDYFMASHRNPYVNRFEHRVDFEANRTFLGILDFFGSHPQKHVRLGRDLEGTFDLFCRSEMFFSEGYIVKGSLAFNAEGEGFITRTTETHRYDGRLDDSEEISQAFEGYVLEKHSQVYIFSRSVRRGTPKLIIFDKRWTDDKTGRIIRLDGLLLKGSFSSRPFTTKIFAQRTKPKSQENNIYKPENISTDILRRLKLPAKVR